MTEEFKDTVGQVLWFTMFVTPLLTVPFAWRFFKVRKVYRVDVGISLAVTVFCYKNTYYELWYQHSFSQL